MDTNVLKTFIAVCEYSGFSAAAKELGYTQSTVSSQIKQLEKELDVRLFDRYYHKPESVKFILFCNQLSKQNWLSIALIAVFFQFPH